MSSLSGDDDVEGLERGTVKCDACNLLTHRFIYVESADEHEGKFIKEKWCPKCG